MEDWFRELEHLQGGEYPIRVRLSAAERILDQAEELEKPCPRPGTKRLDLGVRMKLCSLPVPVLLHTRERDTEEIPSEEEQRRRRTGRAALTDICHLRGLADCPIILAQSGQCLDRLQSGVME